MTRCHLTEVTFWHLVTTTSARVTASNHVITTSGYWHVETDMILLIFSHKNANRLTFWHWYFDMDILTWTFWRGHFDAVTLTVPWSTLTCDTITPSHGRTLTRSHFCIDIWHLTSDTDIWQLWHAAGVTLANSESNVWVRVTCSSLTHSNTQIHLVYPDTVQMSYLITDVIKLLSVILIIIAWW